MGDRQRRTDRRVRSPLRYCVQSRWPRLRDQVCPILFLPSHPFFRAGATLTCDIFHERNFTYDDVHVKGAGRIAKVSASVGVPRLVHVSHLNASPSSTSQFYRSKAAGETAIREAFPTATIVRPGPMYGHEDKFLTNMPCMTSLLLFYGPLPDLWLYNQCGPSGGSLTTDRPRLGLFMYASIPSVSFYVSLPHLSQGIGCRPGPLEPCWNARHRPHARASRPIKTDIRVPPRTRLDSHLQPPFARAGSPQTRCAYSRACSTTHLVANTQP